MSTATTQDGVAAADFLRRLSVADAKVLLDRTRCATKRCVRCGL